MPTLTLAQIAELTGGRVSGDASRVVTGAAPPESAGPSDVTFVFSEKALATFLASPAGAAVIPEKSAAPGRDVVLHRSPAFAMTQVLAALHPERRPAAGVHPTAVVDATARVAATAHVGACAVIAAGAEIADGAVVEAGCVVGEGSRVGERTRLFPRVVLYDRVTIGRDCVIHSGVVIGADGFGFMRAGGRHRKIPQVGGVVIGDDVEIGANTCVDRGTMQPTRIGTNTKIDNLVQVGHNCEIGERVILCGQVALAGSTRVEDDVTLAGQVGAAGHLTIGRGAIAAAGSGITSSVEPGTKVAGHPHVALQEWLRMHVATRELPELRAVVRRLERRVAELEGGAGGE